MPIMGLDYVCLRVVSVSDYLLDPEGTNLSKCK